MKTERIWTRRFVLLLISLFFCAMVMYMLMTTIAEFTATFQSSGAVAGLASGIYVLGALLSRLWSGQAMGRVGWKRMAILGLGIHLIACLGYFIVTNAPVLLLVRFVHGIGFGIGMNAILVIAYSIFPKKRYGEASGYFMLAPTVATGIGPYVGGHIYDTLGSTGCFEAAFFCALISFLFGAAVNLNDVDPASSKARGAARSEEVRRGKGLGRFLEPSAVPLSCSVFLFVAGYASVVSFYRSYASECGLEKPFSYLLLIYSVILIFLRTFAGKVQDNHGDNILCIPGLILQTVGLLSIALRPSLPAIILCAAGCAFGYGSTSACCNVIINRNLPVERRALGVTTFFLFNDLGMGVGPVFMGALASAGSYSIMYCGAAGVTAVSLIVYYLVWGRKVK